MKQAVITGGTGSLGQAIASALAEPDWTIHAPGSGELDVRDLVAVNSYFGDTATDLLVCAAGITRDTVLARTTESDWDDVYAVNFEGSLNCAKAALPAMLERKSGHIIFISSFSAVHPPIGQIAYATAKAALLGLARDLAKENGPNNIRVNAILPGFLETRMTSKVSEQRRQIVRKDHVLGRFNTPLEVAKFVRFLHHDLPHTSGQVFQLDSRLG